ncbi:TetR/AcrR family transcriptional regulator [Mucilaginibacter sp. PAMB04168]|uniref:TetR/AcrR family transcriptional regulator n=1 Tax=Mucilaginibacter sp. PAMB04168 TaxID=3138567 RepID=UPI0031F61888
MKKRSGREVIVITAARLFYKQGYSNTGINQIIKESGVVKSTFYQIFRSKEDLLIAYLESTGEQTVESLAEVIRKQETPKAKLLAVFEYLEDLVQTEDFYGCHFLNMVYELPENSDKIREQVKKQKDNVRRLFAEALAPLENEDLADEIYTLFEGALIGHKVHLDTWPIISASKIIKKLL